MAVTGLYAAMLALMLVGLSFYVIRGRIKHHALFGDAGDAEMNARIRAQANFCEYVPLALLLVALAEYQGAALWLVHLLGGALVVGRGCHAYSLLVREREDAKKFGLRIAGVQMTFAVLLIGAACALYHYVNFKAAD